MVRYYETINEEVFEMNKTKEHKFSYSEVIRYLEELISMNMEQDYELEAYNDIKQYGKVKGNTLKKIKYNMFKLYNEKF